MYFLNPRLAADMFDGEYIIANLDTGLYYSLQGIAVSMVTALPFSEPTAVISTLKEAFPEKSSIIEQELTSVLAELVGEEIIKEGDIPEKESSPVCVPPNEYKTSRFNRYADMQDLLLLDPIHDVDEQGWTVQNEKD